VAEPANDLPAQLQHLERLLKDHEDMSNMRYESLMVQLETLQSMLAALPSHFVGRAEIPFLGGIATITLGPKSGGEYAEGRRLRMGRT